AEQAAAHGREVLERAEPLLLHELVVGREARRQVVGPELLVEEPGHVRDRVQRVLASLPPRRPLLVDRVEHPLLRSRGPVLRVGLDLSASHASDRADNASGADAYCCGSERHFSFPSISLLPGPNIAFSSSSTSSRSSFARFLFLVRWTVMHTESSSASTAR